MPETGDLVRQSVPLLGAAVLTWTAGFVDAVGFLRVGQIYTANMSGNSVALGIGMGELHWWEAARRLWPVAVYVAGLLTCRLLVEAGARLSMSHIASMAFLVEVGCLVPPLFAGSSAAVPGLMQNFVIACLSLAMGIQNGALTHFSSLTLHTGFVTGTLVKMSEQWTRFFTWLYDRAKSGGMGSGALWVEALRQETFRLGAFLALIWSTYVVGAVAGAVAQSGWGLRSLLIAIALLLMMIGLDQYQPLGKDEERAQAGS